MLKTKINLDIMAKINKNKVNWNPLIVKCLKTQD